MKIAEHFGELSWSGCLPAHRPTTTAIKSPATNASRNQWQACVSSLTTILKFTQMAYMVVRASQASSNIRHTGFLHVYLHLLSLNFPYFYNDSHKDSYRPRNRHANHSVTATVTLTIEVAQVVKYIQICTLHISTSQIERHSKHSCSCSCSAFCYRLIQTPTE